MEPAKEPEPEESLGDASPSDEIMLLKAAPWGNDEHKAFKDEHEEEDEASSNCSGVMKPTDENDDEADRRDRRASTDLPADEDDEVDDETSSKSASDKDGEETEEQEQEDQDQDQDEEPSSQHVVDAASASAAGQSQGGLRLRFWRKNNHQDDEPKVGDDDAGIEEASGTNEAVEALDSVNSQPWAVVDRKGEVVAEDDGLPLTTGSIEAKIEQLLTWMLAPAVHGIPALGVPSAVDRADEIIASVTRRDVESAVREVVAGSERTVSSLVTNFCLERIPFLGCPTVLLKNMWGNLRSILIIAALYGHDLERPRTHHEALLCLVPPGEECAGHRRTTTPYTLTAGFAPDADHHSGSCAGSPLVTETAHKVARMMIKGALRRATGLQAAADCFELASLLYNSCMHESVNEDGYVCVAATPASAARDFFKRKSLASWTLLWCSLPLLLVGVAAPHLFVAARMVPKAFATFQTLGRLPRCVPIISLILAGFPFFLHTLAAVGGERFQKFSPGRLWRRVAWGREARMVRDASPQIVTMLVFTLHALLPAFTAYSAVSMVLESVCMAWVQPSPGWDRLHGIACMMLGLYSFCTCVTSYMKSEKQEAISGDNASPSMRRLLRFFSAGWAGTRACCILAAWTYALLVLDLAATRIESWSGLASNSPTTQQTSMLGIIGPLAWLLRAPLDGNLLWNERAVAFSLRIVSVGCQQRLFDLLARREVLLRLIGAEHITAQTVCLLLKGVAVACSQSTSANPIQEFFDTVTPPPVCCVLVVAARAQAVVLGSMLAITPWLTCNATMGSGASLASGLVGGSYGAHAVLRVWYESQEDLESSALRLALLVPGSVNAKAKGLLSGALAGVRKRAVQMMAMGIIQRFIRWCFRPAAALTNL